MKNRDKYFNDFIKYAVNDLPLTYDDKIGSFVTPDGCEYRLEFYSKPKNKKAKLKKFKKRLEEEYTPNTNSYKVEIKIGVDLCKDIK